MQDSPHSLAPLWAEIRAELRNIRAERAARKALRRELAGATSPGDFVELDAILARYTEAETTDIRHILNERRPAWQPSAVAVAAGQPAPGE